MMLAAFIAALMSSFDSNLHSASTLWTQDILAKLRKTWSGRDLTNRQSLRLGRLTGIVLLLSAALFHRPVNREAPCHRLQAAVQRSREGYSCGE